jgi:hypothetical protein
MFTTSSFLRVFNYKVSASEICHVDCQHELHPFHTPNPLPHTHTHIARDIGLKQRLAYVKPLLKDFREVWRVLIETVMNFLIP